MGSGEPGIPGLGVGGEILEEDGGDDRVEGVVAVDAEAPQGGDEEGVDDDSGERVEGEDERLEEAAQSVGEIKAEDEADEPETRQQHRQRDERGE